MGLTGTLDVIVVPSSRLPQLAHHWRMLYKNPATDNR
jgi:hypothetical protein